MQSRTPSPYHFFQYTVSYTLGLPLHMSHVSDVQGPLSSKVSYRTAVTALHNSTLCCACRSLPACYI